MTVFRYLRMPHPSGTFTAIDNVAGHLVCLDINLNESAFSVKPSIHKIEGKDFIPLTFTDKYLQGMIRFGVKNAIAKRRGELNEELNYLDNISKKI